MLRFNLFSFLAVLFCIAVGAELAGCASGPMVRDPGGVIAVRAAWPQVHAGASALGVCSDDPPAYLVARIPHDEASPAPSSGGSSASSPAPAAPAAPSAPAPAAAPSVAPPAPTAPPAPGKARGGGVGDGVGDRR